MKILEVKNNLVKLHYDTASDNLVLSGFIVIKDVLQSFIGQIIHLESSAGNNTGIAKLLFTFDNNGVITSYSGAVPNSESELDIVNSQELLELLPLQSPIFMGELAQQGIKLNLDKKIFEDKLLVCCEKEGKKEILSENFVSQLIASGSKVLAIDLNGNFDENMQLSQTKIVAGKNFKLPLNYETINFIYEKGIDDATAETKALIQEVFLEVQNYVKTLPEQFIPFESFKNVVDSQYEEMDLVELLLLKNKLLKYYDAGVFAQEESEFNSLKNSLKTQLLTVLDLSKSDENIQREILSYAYSLIAELDEKVYVVLNVNDDNSDKKLLKQIFTTKNAYSAIICDYSYKYIKELKQLSKNLILFAPIQQQNDFAAYNVFLNKLNEGEFVVYGQSTQHMPLIVKLEKAPQIVKEHIFVSPEDLLDEEIMQDVDAIYSAPKADIVSGENSVNENEFSVEMVEDDLTDADLDFLDEELVVETSVEEQDFEPIEEEPDLAVEDYLSQLEEQAIAPDEHVLEEEIEIVSEEESNIFQDSFSNVMEQQAQVEQEPPALDILPANMSAVPIVPIYSAEVESAAISDELVQGDIITHPKYGKGVVEKMISYGSKTLCSINFDNVGRRLLDPNLAELKKV